MDYGLTSNLVKFSFYGPYHMEELFYAANMLVLAKTRNTRIAGQTVHQLQLFQKTRPSDSFGLPVTVKDLKTATAILEVSRWATNPALDLYTRYVEFAVPVCKMVDPAPFDCSQTPRPESPEPIGAVQRFELWLATQREPLQKEAKTEDPWAELTSAGIAPEPPIAVVSIYSAKSRAPIRSSSA